MTDQIIATELYCFECDKDCEVHVLLVKPLPADSTDSLVTYEAMAQCQVCFSTAVIYWNVTYEKTMVCGDI